MVDKIWFPALNVAAHYHADFPAGAQRPKKIDEMMTVVIAIAGIQERQGKEYWIQGVSDAEETPDVRTVCCDLPSGDAAPMCYQQDVEVVTYTPHSASQTIAEFVSATKLAPTSPYDPRTTILVNVQAPAPLGSAEEWAAIMSKTGKKNPVFVLGLLDNQIPLYRLAIVHPPEVAFDYNPYKLLEKQGYTQVQIWSRGTKNKESYDPSIKHCPFEKFGVRCRLL